MSNSATTQTGDARHITISYTDGAPLLGGDPRAMMARSVQAARAVVARVDATNASSPTPCAEWNALDLARHIVAVLDRAAAGPTDADIPSMPILADVGLDDLDAAVAAAAERLQTNWSDDATLARTIVLPFGEFPGAATIGIYAAETLVHTWDLAVALGVSVDWPEMDTPIHYEMAKAGIPESPRDEMMPFDPVVRPAPDAPAIEHLVGWQGRDVDRWRVAR